MAYRAGMKRQVADSFTLFPTNGPDTTSHEGDFPLLVIETPDGLDTAIRIVNAIADGSIPSRATDINWNALHKAAKVLTAPTVNKFTGERAKHSYCCVVK